MSKPSKTIATTTLTILSSSLGFILPHRAIAAEDPICDNPNVSDGIKASNGCPEHEGEIPELPNVIINILNGIIISAGIVAVIFVVVGGIQFMTSSGDPAKIKKAKDTIFYSLIGLIVCALSFAIVNFLIKNILG